MPTTGDLGATGRTHASRRSGAYGERVAARHLVEQGMVVLDRNWRCDEGEIDLVLRDGDVLVVCEVKTRTSLRVRHARTRRSPTPSSTGCSGSAQRWAEDHGVRPPDIRVDLVGGAAAAARGRPWSTTCGGSADAVRHRPHRRRSHGALGHLIDVQADVSPGQVGAALVGRPDAVAQRGARPVPDGDHQQRPRLAGHQAGHDPALAGRPAQARHPLRPRIAVAVLAAAAAGAAGALRRHGVHRRAHARPAGCARCPACCRWCWPPPSAASRGSSCPSRRRARRRWCPA